MNETLPFLMRKTLKGHFVFVLLAFISPQLLAQGTFDSAMSTTATATGPQQFRKLSIGINVGVLAPAVITGGKNDFTKWLPTFGYSINVKRQFTHYAALQADFLKGTLKANNDNASRHPSRNPYSSYKTDLNWSGSISGVATFGNVNWFDENYPVIAYVSVGGGLASYTPTVYRKDNAQKIKWPHNVNEFFIPVAAGLKVKVSPLINIDFGYRMQFVDGDNLDGYWAGPEHDKFSYGFAGVEFALGDKAKPQLMLVNPVKMFKQDLMDENEALKASLMASQEETEQKIALIGNLQEELAQLKQDSDSDGVSDYFDKCPSTDTTEKVDGAGCPLPKSETIIKEAPKATITEEDKRILKEAFEDLEFDAGKATIRSKSYATLDKVADLLVKKNFSLKLAGHTDNTGSESANLKLSKDRAESLKAYLVSKGANPSRIEATGYGETQPIASNKTEAGRQKNRRVEFTLY
jgi:OOP family OmpA-OmpF porin